ncbi:MAG: endonuclease/exonuclease/phosphatase family protein [Pirellulales bacterium]
MIPDRISMVSYNLWNVERWPDREPALANFLTSFRPDILCLQEVRTETMECISQSLKTHEHVRDELPGWACESNIFWNRNYFTKVAHGLEKLDMPEQHRGFFWVRLKLVEKDTTIFIATAHYTWQEDPSERETGLTPRNAQMRQSISWLKNLVLKDEPAFFMGDLNDPIIPHLFLPEISFQSCFRDLNLLCPPTYPALPTTHDINGSQTIDWIFSNRLATVISASVPQCYYNGIAPSDHWPVQAIYQL